MKSFLLMMMDLYDCSEGISGANCTIKEENRKKKKTQVRRKK